MPDRSLMRLHSRLVRKVVAQAYLHLNLVDDYSYAEALLHNSFQRAFVINDYLHFCYAKSARSLEAIGILVEQAFREDAFVLLRTVYENYLHFWFVLRNPQTIDSFVTAKIGRSIREFEHPKTGPQRHLRVLNPESGKEYLYGRSMTELARNGSPRISKDLHELLYEYLCEFTHNHFMSSGGYRELHNEAKITARRKGKNLEVAMYAVLLSSMWMESFLYLERPIASDMRRVRYQIKSGREILLEVQAVLKSEGKYVRLMSEVRHLTSSLGSKITL
jgi:hypothetical protein